MNLTNKLIMWDFGFCKAETSLQQGKRPAYVIRDFGKTLLIAPLTTKRKNGQPTHCVIRRTGERSIVLLEQIVQVNRPLNPVVIGVLCPEDRRRVLRSLNIAIGLTPFRIRRKIAPRVFRGQVFNLDQGESVVIQNNVGNSFSPTTIVADIVENDKNEFKIVGIRTIDKKMLENVVPIKELRTNRALRKFIS